MAYKTRTTQQSIASHHNLSTNSKKASSTLAMSTTPPPIPFHSKPARSTALAPEDRHTCLTCKDLRRFPYQPDRCPLTGGDISYKIKPQEMKRRLEQGDEGEHSDVPVRVEGMIYCTLPTAKVIARWILYCEFEGCPGFRDFSNNKSP